MLVMTSLLFLFLNITLLIKFFQSITDLYEFKLAVINQSIKKGIIIV